jgi:pyruvate/2-oxoglutarate dehydrogenase complex dihydrolipoamide acyltransferase (E2) component
MGEPTRGAAVEIRVPDIGDLKEVPIIEIHVRPGDAIQADDPLVTLESDKATMDVPADQDGTVESLLVKLGDKVSQGSPIARLARSEGKPDYPPQTAQQQSPSPMGRGAPLKMTLSPQLDARSEYRRFEEFEAALLTDKTHNSVLARIQEIIVAVEQAANALSSSAAMFAEETHEDMKSIRQAVEEIERH